MATVRKNIKTQEFQELFSVNTEVYDVLEMIRFKAKRLDIKCCFKAKQEVLLYGNALKFNQIIANIVSNAVDSYVDSVAPKNRRTVYINLKKRKSIIILSVADHGGGIPADVQDTVFDPFITTKTNGLGLGLSTTKDIIEHDFAGTISFVSTQDDGTIFTIEIPSRLHE